MTDKIPENAIIQDDIAKLALGMQDKVLKAMVDYLHDEKDKMLSDKVATHHDFFLICGSALAGAVATVSGVYHPEGTLVGITEFIDRLEESTESYVIAALTDRLGIKL